MHSHCIITLLFSACFIYLTINCNTVITVETFKFFWQKKKAELEYSIKVCKIRVKMIAFQGIVQNFFWQCFKEIGRNIKVSFLCQCTRSCLENMSKQNYTNENKHEYKRPISKCVNFIKKDKKKDCFVKTYIKNSR